MHWVLQQGFEYETGWNDLIDVLERDKISYSTHKVVPFEGTLIPELNLVNMTKIFCLGSYSMRKQAKKYGWIPGVIDLEDTVDFEAMYNWSSWYYYEKTFDDGVTYTEYHPEHPWGKHMLNKYAWIGKFGEFKWEDNEISEDCFIRPLDDTKVFAGRVFAREEFEKWQQEVMVAESKDYFNNNLFTDTKIIVADPKEILKEYRFWIVNDRIVTSSGYKIGHRVTYWKNVDREVSNFVEFLINSSNEVDYWRPADAYVLDVAETWEGFRVIELNTINSAGFYAGDVYALVRELETYFNDQGIN